MRFWESEVIMNCFGSSFEIRIQEAEYKAIYLLNIEKVKDKLIFQINEFFINFSFLKLILKERTRKFWIPNVASTQWPP